MTKTLTLLSAVLVVVACDGGGNLMPKNDMPGLLPMVPIAAGQGLLTATGSCDNLHEALRARERRIIDRQLDANLVYALQLVNNPGEFCFDPDAGDDCGFLGFGCSNAVSVATPDVARGGAEGPQDLVAMTDRGAEDFSTTNVQEVGVDEPDFIKNDDRTIYIVGGNELRIYDAWPVEEAHLLSSTTLPGTPQRMFVDEGRAVIFSGRDNEQCSWDAYYGVLPDDASLTITVLDLSDPEQPVLERRLEIGGNFVGARLVDGVVHTVVDFANNAYDSLDLWTWPASLPQNLCANPVPADLIEAAFAELRALHHSAIDDMDIEVVMPTMTDLDFETGSEAVRGPDPYAACEHYYDTDAGLSRGFLSLVSFPVADDSTLGATTIFGRHGTVYGSLESLYIAVAELIDDPGAQPMDFWRVRERTVVHKLSLSANAEPAAYAGSGEVPGRIINQFALDEHDGYLRIATGDGGLGGQTSNSIFVLAETGNGLVVIGEVRDIAPGEDIRAVRFDDTRGFMVTFRQTDPLFTFDLSDANNPRLVGELEIPGFSTYLHFMDPDHLLTIGYDGDEWGSFNSVALQIFDISDMKSPALTHRESITTHGSSSSEAAGNHMAFNYFPSRDLLAVPMAICTNWDNMSFNGLLVYRVTAEDGFESLGGVDHGSSEPWQDCWSWWMDPSSKVKRSVFLEDYVYSVSGELMKVNHVPALEQDLGSFTLPRINDEPQCSWW